MTVERQNIASICHATWIMAAVFLTLTVLSDTVTAQLGRGQRLTSNQRPLLRDSMPDGLIGNNQVKHDWRLQGYFQAIEITGPEGMQASVAQAGSFSPLQDMPLRAAFQVGQVYRVKLTGIPYNEGAELFPTIELIDRTYAPVGREHRFPIPIAFDFADLEDAINGAMVTRVVYLENNQIAEPISYADGNQRVYDVSPSEDALQTADRLGRPVAIIRLGSRVPVSLDGDLTNFCFGFPHWSPIKPVPNRQQWIDRGVLRDIEYPQSSGPIARIDLKAQQRKSVQRKNPSLQTQQPRIPPQSLMRQPPSPQHRTAGKNRARIGG